MGLFRLAASKRKSAMSSLAALCSGVAISDMLRNIRTVARPKNVQAQACLPGNPKSDMIYVDMILYLANGNTEEIKREKGIGIVSGLLNFYTALDYDSLSVHYIRTVGNVGFLIHLFTSILQFKSV